MNLALDRRPLIVALAGPNSAGKTTFYHAHLQPAGLRFVNADVLAQDLHVEPYAAARVVDAVRHELVKQRESFVFETVFSDPVGEKLAFLKSMVEEGYNTILCFIGTAGPEVCEQRVATRGLAGRTRCSYRETGRAFSADPGQSAGGSQRTPECFGLRQ